MTFSAAALVGTYSRTIGFAATMAHMSDPGRTNATCPAALRGVRPYGGRMYGRTPPTHHPWNGRHDQPQRRPGQRQPDQAEDRAQQQERLPEAGRPGPHRPANARRNTSATACTCSPVMVGNMGSDRAWMAVHSVRASSSGCGARCR